MSSRRVVWALVVFVAAMAGGLGCGPSSDETPTRSTATDAESSVEAGLHGPGSKIEDGIVVPAGASLAGTPFRSPGTSMDGTHLDSPGERKDRWTAILVLHGDPFVVFDALAEQIRTVTGASMPGTSDSCYWLDEPPEDPPKRIAANDAGSDGIRCNAIASTGREGDLVAYEITLEWNETQAAFAALTRQHWPDDIGPVAEGAQAMAIAGWDDGGYDDVAEPSTLSVPKAASDHLVEPPEPSILVGPEAGVPFGPTVGCFARGDARFEAPPGTRGVTALQYQAFLAVDDAQAAIADLRRQLTSPNLHPDSHEESNTQVLADGTQVASYSHEIQAGGDSCGVETSPDGHHLWLHYAPGG